MSQSFDIVRAEYLDVLGLLDKNVLIGMASDAMNAGDDDEDIVQIAICADSEIDEMRRLFQQLLLKRGGGAMSKIDALKHYAKEISGSILRKTVSPVEGAKAIWRASLGAQIVDFHELDPFIYAASEIDDRPSENAFFVNAIVEEARRWAPLT